jgi:CheY-like chemotaxis protein
VERPDVMVTDIGMPGEDGYSLIRRVREWERARGAFLPAVALTAYGRTEDRMRALKAGFQMHVAKPVDPDELAIVITSLIRRPKSDEKT